jgi:formylglycine-generating enzyme required for sulfatase activity
MGTATITVTTADGAKTAALDAAVYPSDMVSVAGGTFQRDGTATNLSTVSPFKLGKYTITQAQYLAVMGSNPSANLGDLLRPVEGVSWYAALVFCNRLSMSEGLTPVYSISGSTDPSVWGVIPVSGYPAAWNAVIANLNADGYRLPTEMEWMWAAMGAMSDARSGDIVGGTNTGGYSKYYAGSTELGAAVANIGAYAWNGDNVNDNVTKRVGTKQPNELGLYDMSGNVWQWCMDFNATASPDSNITVSGAVKDYTGPSIISSGYRTIHGGSYDISASSHPVDFQLLHGRHSQRPAEFALQNLGFRVAQKSVGSYLPRSGLVGEYLFTGVGNASDTSGNVRTGTISNWGSPLTDRLSRPNSALYKNTDHASYVFDAGNSYQYGYVSSFTVSIWFKMDNLVNTEAKILEQTSAGGQFNYFLYPASSTLWASVGQNGAPGVSANVSAPISANTWYHAVIVYSSQVNSFYLNGAYINSATCTASGASTNSGTLSLGSLPYEDPGFYGSFDDLRIYNRALSAAEVSALYHEGGYMMK